MLSIQLQRFYLFFHGVRVLGWHFAVVAIIFVESIVDIRTPFLEESVNLFCPVDNEGVTSALEYFSNSEIIHKEKIKEIATVKEVWICDPNYHNIRWTFVLNLSKKY